MILLALLPIISFCLIYIAVKERNQGWREAFLKASMIWALILTLGTEALSPFHLLNRPGLSVFWCVVLILILFFINFQNLRNFLPLNLVKSWPPIWVFSFGVILGTTFLVALFAAPNNWDSMTYHMARVEHWLLNESISHYSNSNIRQLMFNPWAEYAILHFQILTGNEDYLANLVQWFSFLGCMICASFVAKELKASSFAQILTALVVATTPMIILQSTSTQNSLVCGYFIICAAYFCLRAIKSERLSDFFFLSLAVALAIETKGTAYLFLFPFLVWVGIVFLKKRSYKKISQLFVLGCLLVGITNGSYWVRNYKIWKSPLGQSSVFTQLDNERHDLSALGSNIIRNLALHIGTPSPRVNAKLTELINWLHQYVFHLDINSKDTTYLETKFSIDYHLAEEDYSGNPLQLILFLVALVMIFGSSKFKNLKELKVFTVCTVGGFVIFCFLFKWEPWHSRLHTQIFVLASVPIGLAFGQILDSKKSKGLQRVFVMLLFISSLPWVFLNYTRSVFSIESKERKSVFATPRMEQYFTGRWKAYPAYEGVIEELSKRPQCHSVGLKIGGDTWEYPLYMMAKDKKLDLILRDVRAGTPNMAPDPAEKDVCELIIIEQGDEWMAADPDFKSMKLVWSKDLVRLYERQ